MHYLNGREAKVGDRVVGRLYNTKGLVAGTLMSVTPGPDACSAMVGFLVTEPVPTEAALTYSLRPVAVLGSANHGNSGPVVLTQFKMDYTECKNLLHIDDIEGADGRTLMSVLFPEPAAK